MATICNYLVAYQSEKMPGLGPASTSFQNAGFAVVTRSAFRRRPAPGSRCRASSRSRAARRRRRHRALVRIGAGPDPISRPVRRNRSAAWRDVARGSGARLGIRASIHASASTTRPRRRQRARRVGEARRICHCRGRCRRDRYLCRSPDRPLVTQPEREAIARALRTRPSSCPRGCAHRCLSTAGREPTRRSRSLRPS